MSRAAPRPPLTTRRPTIAKRKKRRPAGPPPAKSPKLEREQQKGASTSGRPQRPRRGSAPPVEPSFRSVAIRAALIAGVYYLFLVFLLQTEPGVALVVAAFGFALMLPLGYLIDRWRYRSQMKKWEARRTGGA